MVLILSVFFVILGLINLARGRKVIYRPGIIKMDLISMVLVVIIFAIFTYVLKSNLIASLALIGSMIFYFLTSRYSRGITDRGALISAGNPMLLREFLFKEIKQVNVATEDDLVSFAVVIRQRNFVDILRFPKEKKPDLIKIFKDNNVEIIYK